MGLRLTTKKKILVGVIHLEPLPGSPRWHGSMETVRKKAVADARTWERGGADAVILENFGDVPFRKSAVGAETVAAMSAVGGAVREAVRLPIGFNVLRNDACAALALCAACQGSFIRVNVHTGVMVTDQGLLEGDAANTLRYRVSLDLNAHIFADVHVKHAVPLSQRPIADTACDTWVRGLADALIVTGPATGHPADLAEVKAVRQACPQVPLFLGSGVTSKNIDPFLPWINGVIVGTAMKGPDGRVELRRVSRLMEALGRRSR